ncbi:MAG: hypothetical protein UT31_C0001G0015 [Parcubacteria group bacterium GW2011_GWF2_39_13b]|nr:MAG: hypothetical protein UT31_C0001G0015 [Parcubacteria group bacterium GW2011_GWF2_39_13b]
MEKTYVDISTSTIIRFVLIVALIGVLYFLRDVFLIIFAALILATALDRPIDILEEKGVPRFLGVILIYLLLFAVIAWLFYLVFPVLALQIKNFVNNYSFYLRKLGQLQAQTGPFDIKDLFNQLADKLTASADTVWGTLVSFFGGVVSFFTVLVAAIFFNVQEKGVRKFIFYLTPKKNQEYTLGLFDKIQQKVGGWLWGRIVLSIVLGFLVGVGLYFLKIKYALLLGCLAALFSFIPMIGPTIAAIPAVLIGLGQSAFMGLMVGILYVFVFTIIENFILIPVLMKKAVDLNPALIILVILIGAKIAGTAGAILAIPAAAVIAVLIDEYIQKRSEKSKT